MRYISTRGTAPVLSFDDVLLTGLARDGGLYLPETWPKLSRQDLLDLRGRDYAEVATRVMEPFVEGAISKDDLAAMVAVTYAGFGHTATAPLKQLGPDHWVMELFHGPTLSFKDYALQLAGRLFDHVLKARGEKITIVGATSGDTGSAAIEAFRDRDAIEIFILHPKGRVSDVQRRQMTTVTSANVHNIAVEGTFDDCQGVVKAMFNDQAFRDRHKLGAVNSINWARIMAQAAYYVAAAVALGAPDRRFTFAVPTGNFGNIFAAFVAQSMGLDVDRLVAGSNSNDILTRFFKTGRMETRPVVPTSSPSMDIQVSSNFERILFYAFNRDSKLLSKAMERFRQKGATAFGKAPWNALQQLFEGHCLDDRSVETEIRRFYKTTGEIFDPHSVIGLVAGERAERAPGSVLVSIATAHPAKFPDVVEKAIEIRPALPPHLADLLERPERFDVFPNDPQEIKAFIAGCRIGKGAL